MGKFEILIQKIVCFIGEVKAIAINIFGSKSNVSVDYKDLAPINNVKECEEHIRALNWAIDNPNIKNIALTGPYGSGKSSVINTFLERNLFLKRKSIRISLAKFCEKKTDLNLEEEILKQLFYKVDYKKIPQSRYRKIHKVKFKPILLMVLLCFILATAFFYIFKPFIFWENVKLIIIAGSLFKLSKTWSLIIFLTIISFICVLISKSLQFFYSRFDIKELKIFKDSSINKADTPEDKIFNKNIDEIVYFFEETNYDIVFIEDLDRFGNENIFIELRDLNIILNNYDAINRKIVFVYAVVDDLFNGEERTKFFDFIIPIIPVINSTNSNEILMELFINNINKEHDIHEEFILDISPYISDMRILQNIYNEFIIYKETLKKQQGLTTLIDEHILSLIVFKNLYPSDFAQLQKENGIIKDAFNDKEKFLVTQTRVLEKKRTEISEKLANLDNDIIKNKRELKWAMLGALTQWQGILIGLRNSNGNNYSREKILSDDFDINNFMADGRWYINKSKSYSYSPSESQIDMKEICTPYLDRWENLEYASKETQEQFKQNILDIDKEIYDISSYSLETLIKKYGVKEVLKTENIEQNKLLIFMLRKGYINEKYVDYINYFKGNSITINDMKFIHSIKNQNPLSFNYSLSKTRIPQIIRRIHDYEFGEKAALNFDLMEHMLKVNCYDEKLDIFIKQLANEKNYSWKFIDEFIDLTENKKLFIQLLSSKWTRFWDYIYSNQTLSNERKIHYFILICMHTDLDSLVNLNQNNNISNYIEENENILQWIPENLNRGFEGIISRLDISFCKLNIDNVSSSLLDYIFNNFHYELNEEMIKNVVKHKNDSLLAQLTTQNYTTVLELDYKELVDNIHKNINKYIDDVVLLPNNTKESTLAILDLLDRIITDKERCKKIIEHEQFIIANLEEVCKDLLIEYGENVNYIWDLLLINNKINISWENVYSYWSEFDVSNCLLEYIANNKDYLKVLDCNVLTDEFKESMILSNMDYDTFNTLSLCLKMKEFKILISNIPKNKLVVMIDKNCIKFDLEIYKQLEETYIDLCPSYIFSNQNAFLNNMQDIDIDENTFEKIIFTSSFDFLFKEQVVHRYGADLMSKDTASFIVQSNMKLNKESYVLAWEKLDDIKEKEILLFNHLDILDVNDFEMYLPKLNKPYCNLYRNKYRHDVLLDNNEDNLRLAERLVKINYLTSYTIEPLKFNDLTFVNNIRCRVKAKS